MSAVGDMCDWYWTVWARARWAAWQKEQTNARTKSEIPEEEARPLMAKKQKPMKKLKPGKGKGC